SGQTGSADCPSNAGSNPQEYLSGHGGPLRRRPRLRGRLCCAIDRLVGETHPSVYPASLTPHNTRSQIADGRGIETREEDSDRSDARGNAAKYSRSSADVPDSDR